MTTNESNIVQFPQVEHKTAKEVKGYFRSSEAMVYEWFKQGVFPPNVAFRIGRKILFNKIELEKWIANGGTASQTSETRQAA